MLSEQDFVIRLRKLLADRTPLGVEEFITKTKDLFEGHPSIRVEDTAIQKLISEGYLSVNTNGAILPLEFLKLNPLDLLTAVTGGGMAFSKHQLERIFGDDFMMVDFRQMKECPKSTSVFGKDFLWVVLFQKVR